MTARDDLQALWRGAPAPVPTLDMDRVRRRGAELAREARRRSLRETLAGGLGMVAVATLEAAAPGVVGTPLLRLGCAVLAVGQAVVLVALWRRGTPRPPPLLAASTQAHLAYVRAELTRERRMLDGVWRWYVAPMLPGLLLVPVALILALAPFTPAPWVGLNLVVLAAVTVAILALIARGQRRTAQRLARELAALDVEGGMV